MFKKNGKSPALLKIIWKFLKPLDSKLKRYEDYAKPRNKLRKRYHRSIGRRVRSDFFSYYTDNFDEQCIDECLILLDSFWGRKLTCNPYAIYREIVKRDVEEKYRFIWVKDSSAIAPEDIASNSRVSYVAYNTRDYGHALLTAKFLVSNANFMKPFVKKREQVYLATWHGVPLKKVGFHSNEKRLFPISNTQRNFNSADVVITGSDYSTRLVPLAYKSLCHNVWEVGHPRVDMTLNANREEVRGKLGVSKETILVLYAPTYRGAIGDIKENFDLELSAIQALRNSLSDQYEVYVSVHNYVLSKLSSQLKGVKLVPSDVDTNEFLAAVDILVSDYSSILIDYLVLDKPIVLYVPDLELYNAERGLHQNVREMPVSVCMTVEELLQSIATPKKPSSFKCYLNFKNLVIPNDDGSASRRAVDLLFSKDLTGSDIKVRYKKNESYIAKEKLRLIVYPGIFTCTAETRSFIAFSRMLDYSKYELYYLVNCRGIDTHEDRRANFDEVDERAVPILRSYQKVFSREETRKYKSIIMFNGENKIEAEAAVSNAFVRESCRIFGRLEYDLAIDFLGTSYFYSRLITSVKSKKKLLIHHRDIFSSVFSDESQVNPNGLLNQLSSLKAYRHFDCIVSLNKLDKKRNEITMRGFYSENVSHHLMNFDFNQSYRSYLINLAQQSSLSSTTETKLTELKGVKFFIHLSAINTDHLHAFIGAFLFFVENNFDVSLLVYGQKNAINKLHLKFEALSLNNYVICCSGADHYLSLAECSDFAIISKSHGRLNIFDSEFQALGVKVIDLDTLVVRRNTEDLKSVIVNNFSVADVPNDILTLSLINALQSKVNSEKSDFNNETNSKSNLNNDVNSIDHFLTEIVRQL